MALADAFTADSTGSGCRGGACPNSSVGGGFCRSPSDLGSPGTVGRLPGPKPPLTYRPHLRPEAMGSPTVTFYSPESFVRRVAPMLPQEIRRASCCPPRNTSIATPMPSLIAADNLAGLHSIGGQRQSRPLTIFRLRANRTSRLRELRETSHGQVLPRFSIFR